VPLSPQCMAILGDIKQIGDSDFVFTNDGHSAIGGFSRIKADLDKLMKARPWRFHDLRRTVATGLQKQGIALPIIEKVLNHTGGSFGGIVAIYQRHSFDQEKRTALEAWAAHVDELVTGKPSRKVITLHGKRR
jgi:integrase